MKSLNVSNLSSFFIISIVVLILPSSSILALSNQKASNQTTGPPDSKWNFLLKNRDTLIILGVTVLLTIGGIYVLYRWFQARKSKKEWQSLLDQTPTSTEKEDSSSSSSASIGTRKTLPVRIVKSNETVRSTMPPDARLQPDMISTLAARRKGDSVSWETDSQSLRSGLSTAPRRKSGKEFAPLPSPP